jgi:hypothetical protein
MILKTATSEDDCAHVIDANKAEDRKQKIDRMMDHNPKSSSSRRKLSRLTGKLGPISASSETAWVLDAKKKAPWGQVAFGVAQSGCR